MRLVKVRLRNKEGQQIFQHFLSTSTSSDKINQKVAAHYAERHPSWSIREVYEVIPDPEDIIEVFGDDLQKLE